MADLRFFSMQSNYAGNIETGAKPVTTHHGDRSAPSGPTSLFDTAPRFNGPVYDPALDDDLGGTWEYRLVIVRSSNAK